MNIRDTCYFTDTEHVNGANRGDSNRSMHLLVWRGYGGASRECNLTIDDSRSGTIQRTVCAAKWVVGPESR